MEFDDYRRPPYINISSNIGNSHYAIGEVFEIKVSDTNASGNTIWLDIDGSIRRKIGYRSSISPVNDSLELRVVSRIKSIEFKS